MRYAIRICVCVCKAHASLLYLIREQTVVKEEDATANWHVCASVMDMFVYVFVCVSNKWKCASMIINRGGSSTKCKRLKFE